MDYARTDFREHFWGSKHNGFTVLYQNMKAQALTGKDMVEFIKERSSAEEQYAKHLAKITKQVGVASLATHGSFAPYWMLLKESTEKLSNIHMQVVGKLHDLNRDLLRYNDDLAKRQKLRKDQESETVDVVQAMQTTETALQKVKEVYLLRYSELEKLRKDDASPKDIEKSETKLRKVTEEYQTLVDRYGKTRTEFQDKMCKSCENFQELEEQHLSQLKNIFSNYVASLEFGHALIGELYGDMRRESGNLTTDRLLMSFVDEKGTGCDRPADIKFDALHVDIPALLTSGGNNAAGVTVNANPTGSSANGGVVIAKANTGGSLLSGVVINPTLTGSGNSTNNNNVSISSNNSNERRSSPLPQAGDFPTFPGSITNSTFNNNNRPLSPPSLIHLGESPVMDTRKFFPTVTSSYSMTSTTSTSAASTTGVEQQLKPSSGSFVSTTTTINQQQQQQQQQNDPFTPPPNVVVSMTRSNTGGRATSNNNGYADLAADNRPLGGPDGTNSPTFSSSVNESTTTISNNNNLLIEQQTGNKADKSGAGSGGRGSKWPGFLKFGNRSDKAAKQQQYAAAHAATAGRPVNNSHTIHVSAGGGAKKNITTTSTTGNFDGVFEVSPNWFTSSAASTPTNATSNNTAPGTAALDTHLSKVSSNSSLGAKNQLAPNAMQKGGTLNSVGLDSVGNYSPTMSDDFHLDEEGYRVRKPPAMESDSMRNKLDNTSSASEDDGDDDEDNDVDVTKKIHVRIREKSEMPLDAAAAQPQHTQALEQAARVLIAPQLTGGRGAFTATRTGGSLANNWPTGFGGKPGDSSTLLTMTPSKTGGAASSGIGGNSWMTGGHPAIPSRNRPSQSRQQSTVEQANNGAVVATAPVPPRMLRPAFTGGPTMSSNNANSHAASSYATSVSVIEPSGDSSLTNNNSGRNARSRPRPFSTVQSFAASPTFNNSNATAENQFRRPSAVPVPERQSKLPNAAVNSSNTSRLSNDAVDSSGTVRNGVMPMVGAPGVEPFPISVNLQEKCTIQLDYSTANSSDTSNEFAGGQVSGALVGEVYLAFPYKSIETLGASSPVISFSLTPPTDAVASVNSYQPFEKLLKSIPAADENSTSSSQFSFNMASLIDYLRNEYRKSSKPYILVPAVRYNIKLRSVEQLPFQLLAQCRYSSNRARIEIELDRLTAATDLSPTKLAVQAARMISRLVLKVKLVFSKGGAAAALQNNPVMQSIDCHTTTDDISGNPTSAVASVIKDLSDNSVQVSIADVLSDRAVVGGGNFGGRNRRLTPLVVIEFNYDSSSTTANSSNTVDVNLDNDSAGRAVVVPQVQIEAHFQPSSIAAGSAGQPQQANNCLLSGMKFALEQNITQRAYRVAFLKQQVMSADMTVMPAMNFMPFLPAFTPTLAPGFRRPMSPLEAKRSYESPVRHQQFPRGSIGNAEAAGVLPTNTGDNSPTKLVRSLHDFKSMPDNNNSIFMMPTAALHRRVSNGSVGTTATITDNSSSSRAFETDATVNHAVDNDDNAGSDNGRRASLTSSTYSGDTTPTAKTASRSFITSGSNAGGASSSAPSASYDWLGPSIPTVIQQQSHRGALHAASPPPVTYDFDANWILGSKRKPSLTASVNSTNSTPAVGLNISGVGSSFDQSLQKSAPLDLPSSLASAAQ